MSFLNASAVDAIRGGIGGLFWDTCKVAAYTEAETKKGYGHFSGAVGEPGTEEPCKFDIDDSSETADGEARPEMSGKVLFPGSRDLINRQSRITWVKQWGRDLPRVLVFEVIGEPVIKIVGAEYDIKLNPSGA